MNYDNEHLLEVCDKIDLLDYAQRSIEFNKKGSEWVAHCPLHIDKTPSLFISPSKNRFYCQSCHVGGGIISWLKTFEGLSFNGAVEKICSITGDSVESLKSCDALHYYKQLRSIIEEKPKKDHQRNIYIDDPMQAYSDQLPEEWIEEGIDLAVMKAFGIRIDEGTNRIVYPVYDNDDYLIGIKGRTRYKDYKVLGIQKYMNYTKIGSVDFFQGMKQNRNHIIEKNEIIIVEGIKSVMKLSGWGYDNAVAAETSALSPGQVEILLKMQIRNIVAAFDKDVSYDRVAKIMKPLYRYTNVFIIYDNDNLLDTKDAPCDKGLEVWKKLYNGRTKLQFHH